MNDQLTKADGVAWKRAMARYKATRKTFEKLDAVKEAALKGDALERFFVAEEALMVMRSPSSEAVFEKVMILFYGDTWGADEARAQRETIVRDIWRLQRSGKIRKISSIPTDWPA